MQYLLSEQEMEALRQRDKLPNLDALTNVVMHVATTMIQTAEVNGRCSPVGRPHGCIHASGELRAMYCDYCQVSGICPMPKDFSK